AISAGATHSLTLKLDGTIWAFGSNASGELGDGFTSWRSLPVQVNFTAADGTGPLADPDGDGLPTWRELLIGTDPLNPDTNGDGLLDGVSVDAGLSPTNPDMDGDGVPNPVEVARGTDPFRTDTDGDGVSDFDDFFPLDPTRWLRPPPVPGDVTPPTITL